MLIPPRVPHATADETGRPLEFLIVVEDVPPEGLSKVARTKVATN